VYNACLVGFLCGCELVDVVHCRCEHVAVEPV
jgi:hypothetical protein